VMVWRLPPERAGRAPQASRHRNGAEAVAVRLTLVVDVAEGSGAEGRLAPIMDATPTLPATPNSWRRLTTAGG
jgi:hypothetical protein